MFPTWAMGPCSFPTGWPARPNAAGLGKWFRTYAGLKSIPRRDLVPIRAFRCAKCGYLEMYASQDFEPE
jgi:hypothetical protein